MYTTIVACLVFHIHRIGSTFLDFLAAGIIPCQQALKVCELDNILDSLLRTFLCSSIIWLPNTIVFVLPMFIFTWDLGLPCYCCLEACRAWLPTSVFLYQSMSSANHDIFNWYPCMKFRCHVLVDHLSHLPGTLWRCLVAVEPLLSCFATLNFCKICVVNAWSTHLFCCKKMKIQRRVLKFCVLADNLQFNFSIYREHCLLSRNGIYLVLDLLPVQQFMMLTVNCYLSAVLCY